MQQQNAKNLLRNTRVLLHTQEVSRKLKGEDFNIFSILKMERLEVRTHSAFIAELLNPWGLHYKRDLFLKLFLEECNVTDFDTSGAEVIKEYVIPKTNHRNNIEGYDETGGRIDIFIKDANNKTICIENKIDAGEQNKQLLRYRNYNKENNTLFYLTLFGNKPSEESSEKLKSGEDFFIISYKENIIHWLENCQKEAVDHPILRESIKQYIILLKKITNTMDDKENYELKRMMLENYAEAAYIAENFIVIKETLGEDVRQLTIDRLQQKLGSEFGVTGGNKTSSFYSQIWIRYKAIENPKLYYGLESFSYKSDADLDIGIFNPGAKPISYTNGDLKKGETNYWPYYVTLQEFENLPVNFNNRETLYKIFTDAALKNKLIDHIVEQVEQFIEVHKLPLLTFLQSVSNG